MHELAHQEARIQDFILLIKGMCTGFAYVVPGVSGGTMAFTSGMGRLRGGPANTTTLRSEPPLKLTPHNRESQPS